jgi:hypothetical protein
MTYHPTIGIRIRHNVNRAVTRARRANRGRFGSIPNAYESRKPVYKKDIRLAREKLQNDPEVAAFLAGRDA